MTTEQDKAGVSAAAGLSEDAARRDVAERRLWFRQQIVPLEPELHRFVRRILPDEADVEDIVHDTFVRVMSLASWRGVKTPAAFLKTVARNLVHDLFRHRNVVPIHHTGDLDAINAIDELADPGRLVADRDELRVLGELIESLPPQCRKVFVLRKVGGLSNGAIAKQLGLSVSTVEKHLVKALRFCSEGLARRAGTARYQHRHESRPKPGTRRD